MLIENKDYLLPFIGKATGALMVLFQLIFFFLFPSTDWIWQVLSAWDYESWLVLLGLCLDLNCASVLGNV